MIVVLSRYLNLCRFFALQPGTEIVLTRMYVPSWSMYSSTESSCKQLPYIHTHTCTKTYVFETLSNVERMVV